MAIKRGAAGGAGKNVRTERIRHTGQTGEWEHPRWTTNPFGLVLERGTVKSRALMSWVKITLARVGGGSPPSGDIL